VDGQNESANSLSGPTATSGSDNGRLTPTTDAGGAGVALLIADVTLPRKRHLVEPNRRFLSCFAESNRRKKISNGNSRR
jgi:hypothetical protein